MLILLMACLAGTPAARAATVWTGPPTVFTKADGTDSTLAANQDRLTARVWLTRGAIQGLYNPAREAAYARTFSPADTEWATGTTASYATLTYRDWESWTRSVGNPASTVGINAVLHLKTDDIYIDVTFLSWSQRTGGGFSYQRSTPPAIQTTSSTTSTTTTASSTTTTSSSTTTTLAGSSASVAAGWNLLGNGMGNAIAASSVFGDSSRVTTVWKWLASSGNWAFYTPALADGGAAYAASKGYAFLTTINAGEGFWVNAKSAFSVPLAGNPLASGTFSDGPAGNALPSGWSLIAIGDNRTPAAFANAIALNPPAAGAGVATSVITLWTWDAAQANWYFFAPTQANSGGLANYISSKGYLDFGNQTLTPGTGFWVNHP